MYHWCGLKTILKDRRIYRGKGKDEGCFLWGKEYKQSNWGRGVCTVFGFSLSGVKGFMLESIDKEAWRLRVNLGCQAEPFVLDPERNKGPLIGPGRKWHKGNVASGRLNWCQDAICIHNTESNSSLAFVCCKFQAICFFLC